MVRCNPLKRRPDAPIELKSKGYVDNRFDQMYQTQKIRSKSTNQPNHINYTISATDAKDRGSDFKIEIPLKPMKGQ